MGCSVCGKSPSGVCVGRAIFEDMLPMMKSVEKVTRKVFSES